MSKYDPQLGDLKNQLASASNILVLLPSKVTVDKLASGLSLMLSLRQAGKNAAIATSDTLRVSHGNLYGVGDVKNEVPKTGGNLTVILEGVADSAGKVPALEKLDWYPENGNLNLVFHVIPGQRFEPTNVVSKHEGGNYNLVFVVGVLQPNQLGALQQELQNLTGVTIVNIDNSQNNSNFGTINVVDTTVSSVSEMMMQILQGLGLPLDEDIASNILTGVYDATGNLTNGISADTFIALGQAMQAGGKIPGAQPVVMQSNVQSQPTQSTIEQIIPSQPAESVPTQPVVQPVEQPTETIAQTESAPETPQPVIAPQSDSGNQGFDLSKVFQIPSIQTAQNGEEEKKSGQMSLNPLRPRLSSTQARSEASRISHRRRRYRWGRRQQPQRRTG